MPILKENGDSFELHSDAEGPEALEVEVERETDGRWIAEIPALPGAMAYGADKGEAVRKAKAVALGVRSDRSGFEDSGPVPETLMRSLEAE